MCVTQRGTPTSLRRVLLHFSLVPEAHGGLQTQQGRFYGSHFVTTATLTVTVAGSGLGIVLPPCLCGLPGRQTSLRTPWMHLSGRSASQLERRSRSPKPPGQGGNAQETRGQSRHLPLTADVIVDLVHSIPLHSELPAVSVRGFGGVVLLLHLLVLHGHLLPELGHAAGARTTRCDRVQGGRSLGYHGNNSPGCREPALTLMF